MNLMSLPSSLNYRHLNQAEFQARRLDYPLSLLQENRVMESLRVLGCRLSAFDSGYDNTKLRSAEIRLGTRCSPGEFAAELINFIPLAPPLAFLGAEGARGESAIPGPPGADPFRLQEYPQNLPEGGDENLYHGITPVNIFRVVFNHYFGADLALLPDRSHFANWQDGYFIFREVLFD